MTWGYFNTKWNFYGIKMEFQKLQIFLIWLLMIKIKDDLLLKNGLKFMITQEEKIMMSTKKLELKQLC